MFDLMPMNRRMPMTFRPLYDFDEFFEDTCKGMMKAFSTDIVDAGDAFELHSELPGFSKEDIKINVKNDLLTISAERKHEDKEEKPNFVKKERYYGTYSRSFDLAGIDADKIEASYTDGVLKLKLPKLQEELPTSRTIEIQ